MKESNYRIHLLYWAIIFAIMTLFMILCVPGRINEDAFTNFSFASVLVSIVLAVISIILSISVGQSTSHYSLQIKDIEKEIQGKLQQFDDLDDSIRSSVEGIVKKEVDEVKRCQNEMNKIIETLVDTTSITNPESLKTGGTLDIASVSHLCVASLYLAAVCNRVNKPLPLSQLKDSLWMIVGFLNALSTVEPENLLLIVRNKDLYVTKFSTLRWGLEDYLKNAVNSIDKQDIKDVVLKAAQFVLDEKGD